MNYIPVNDITVFLAFDASRQAGDIIKIDVTVEKNGTSQMSHAVL